MRINEETKGNERREVSKEEGLKREGKKKRVAKMGLKERKRCTGRNYMDENEHEIRLQTKVSEVEKKTRVTERS